MRREELRSYISKKQFVQNILNNLMDDYNFQLTMTEKRVTDKSNPLTVDEIRDKLNLRFEKLTKR
jgi:hypothetical protein